MFNTKIELKKLNTKASLLCSTSTEAASAGSTKASDGVHDEGGNVQRMNHNNQGVKWVGTKYYDRLAKRAW